MLRGTKELYEVVAYVSWAQEEGLLLGCNGKSVYVTKTQMIVFDSCPSRELWLPA